LFSLFRFVYSRALDARRFHFACEYSHRFARRM